MFRRLFLTAAVSCLAWGGWSSSVRAAPATSAALQRPCSGASFFIEVPLTESALPSTFAQDLKVDLSPMVAANRLSWFCEAHDFACQGQMLAGVQLQVKAVLPTRWRAYRSDGHRRFYRAYFTRIEAPKVPLSVRDGAQCAVVQALREATSSVLGAPLGPVCPAQGACLSKVALSSPDVRIGRECRATAMGAPSAFGAPGAPLERWHREAIGVPAAPAPSFWPQPVDLALVDAGIDPVMKAKLTPASTTDLVASAPVPGLTTAGRHRHGTDMAILVRQVMGAEVRLHDYKIMDGQGVVTSAALAAGLDQVIFDPAFADRPLIVNLSLGFPPELGRRAVLEGDGTCRTLEDGVGEAVRYVLRAARKRDDAGFDRRFVVAAAGNRVGGPPPEDLFATDAGLEHPVPCAAAQAWSQGARFYPSEYGRRPSCELVGGQPKELPPLAFSVSAHDDLGRTALATLDRAEAPVVAPGEHVYVQHSAAAQLASGLICAPHQVGPAVADRYPVVLSGSSVSAALTSAVAARAQVRARQLMGRALTWKELSRLLWLSGESQCRFTRAQQPVRSLSVERALLALQSPAVRARCLSAPGFSTDLDPALTWNFNCRQALLAAGLGAVCPAPAVPLAWTPTYYDRAVCGPGVPATLCHGPAQCRMTCTPGAAGCSTVPAARVLPDILDRHSLAELGPQPQQPDTCPDCQFVFGGLVGAHHGQLSMVLELSPEMDPATRFEAAHVVVTNSFGDQVDIDLGEFTDVLGWVPGESIALDGLLVGGFVGAEADWIEAKAELQVVVHSPKSSYLGGGALRYRADF